MRGVRAGYLDIPRDVLDREIDVTKAVLPRRASTGLDALDRRCGRYRAPGERCERGAAGHFVRAAVWAARGHVGGGGAAAAAGHTGLLQRGQPGTVAAGRSDHFDRTRSQAFAKADVLVMWAPPFDFRMGYGKRISVPTLVQIDMDYRTVGKNRDLTLALW